MNRKESITKTLTTRLLYLAFIIILSIPAGGYLYAFQEFPFSVQTGQVYNPVKIDSKVCSWLNAFQIAYLNESKIRQLNSVNLKEYNKTVYVLLKKQQSIQLSIQLQFNYARLYYLSSQTDNLPEDTANC